MSLSTCIAGLVAEGKIRPGQAQEADRLYGQHLSSLERQMGMMAAAELASERTIAALKGQQLRKELLAALTIRSRQQMAADLGTGPGPIDPDRGNSFFTRRDGAGHMNASGRAQAIERRAFAMIGQVLQTFHTDAIGRIRNAAELPNVVREIFGQDSGSAEAKAMAQAWLQSAEMLRQRFNAAGGDIGKLRDGLGYLPQSHDALKVRQAGYSAWRETIAPLLDREAMIDRTTGAPFTDEALDTALREVFETIRSGGWFKREVGSVGKGATANRRAEERFLRFKDADSWMAYNDQFGHGSAFDAMIQHVRGMARDTAAMERFGPNPEAGVQWLRDTIERDAHLARDDGSPARKVQPALDRMDALWSEFNGASRRPSREWLANVGNAARAYETASKMGSAIIGAVPGDIGTQRVAAKFNDLPFTKVMGNQIALLNPKNAEHRLLAARMGMVFEGWTNRSAGQQRALGDQVAAGAMGQMAETVLRGSGLMAWTDTGHSAFGMTVLGHMADMRGRAFVDLDDGFRRMLERGGIDAKGWDAIRATPVRRELDADWIFADDIADQDLGDRVLAMLASEKSLAVQEADFETRAIMHAGMKSGTVVGETLKSSLLFKSFGISMLLNHGRRMMSLPDWKSRAQYAVSVGITLTLAGAVTLQLREIAKGRDPRPMDTLDFWKAAALQGGGFGMVGDLLNLMTDNRISSWGDYLAGPVFSTANDISKVVTAIGQDLVPGGKEGNVGGSTVRFLTNNLPGGNVWYARLALQRMMLDQLQEAIDPNYRKSWRRMAQRNAEQGTQFFWEPGELAPERAPDFANITEGETLQ